MIAKILVAAAFIASASAQATAPQWGQVRESAWLLLSREMLSTSRVVWRRRMDGTHDLPIRMDMHLQQPVV
jgi:hypothetical protein